MSDDMPTGIKITSNEKPSNGNGANNNMMDQLVAAFGDMDDTQINAVSQALLPGILRYDLIAPRIWGDVQKLSIPDDVDIFNAFFDTTNGGITIEEDCEIGHYCKFVTAGKGDIVIKKGANIQTGCVIVGPCVIEEGATIKAGSVFHEDKAKKNSVWAGNPAQKVD